MAWRLLAIPALLLGVAAAHGQPGDKAKHITFTATVVPSDPFSDMNQATPPAGAKLAVTPGDTVELRIRATPAKDWYTYPLTVLAPDQPPAQLGTLTVEGNESLQPVYPVTEDMPEWKQYGDDVYLIHPTPFTIRQTIYVKPTAASGKTVSLKAKLRVQVCSKVCTWEDHELEVPITVGPGPAVAPTAELERSLAVKAEKPTVLKLPDQFRKAEAVGKPSGPESKEATASPPKAPPGLLGSILAALVGGYVSLLTPCVFPMIPITVSYFLKQSESNKAGKASTLLMATVYCGTLMLVLAVGGLALMSVLVEISVHWATNFALGGIFLFFALSLLGMYDITLPSALQDLTSSGEGKGGLLGVFFMALTFSVVSFACVGPIYGGFISFEATSASTASNYLHRALPVLAFSAAFASPFFVLALFPTLLRSMPRAGSWMNSVKVVMGFLELAAVVKFLRAAELSWARGSHLFTFDVSLGVYIALSLACGLYLLNVYRLPHDHEAPESISVPRLMFSVVFLSLAVYLVPGMFKADDGEPQRPRGTVFAWVESFLLPDVDTGGKAGKPAAGGGSTQLVWKSSLDAALRDAEREKKLVFIDFTGMLCTNCKLNERNVFTRGDVQAALNKHVLLKLYTDYVPAGVEQAPGAEEALKLRNEVFKTGALPLYAVVRPKGDTFDIVRVDNQGLIDDVPAFIKFLTE